MKNKLRPELSEKNQYWISKHRYYELKHFCLQYPTWKKAYAAIDEMAIYSPELGRVISISNLPNDPTGRCATVKAHYAERMKMVEQAAIQADSELYPYILKAVTEDLSFNYLKTRLDIPCGKDLYYDRYRKFFWYLSKLRD